VPRTKRKTVFKPERERKKGLSGGGRFILFVILAIVVIGLLYCFGAHLASLAIAAWQDILSLFGLGLIIVGVALGVIIWVTWRGYFSA